MWAVAIDFRNYDFFIGDTHFISPFFNPDIKIPGWPEWLSPGLILIWAPLGFRATLLCWESILSSVLLGSACLCNI